MAEIRVESTGEESYRVEVIEGGTRTSHDVTARASDVARYGGAADPARLIEASFEFLLEREPKESILARFDLPVIERYFPEYPREIRKRLA
jgi:hypothetical protein